MSRKKLFSGLVLLVLVLVVLSVAHARIKIKDPSGSDYQCDETATDPYCVCMSTIGDERFCGASKTDPDGTTTSWGTRCTDAECSGETTCSNGTKVSCKGEFKAYADETGVRCIDTGSDPGNLVSCPEE